MRPQQGRTHLQIAAHADSTGSDVPCVWRFQEMSRRVEVMEEDCVRGDLVRKTLHNEVRVLVAFGLV